MVALVNSQSSQSNRLKIRSLTLGDRNHWETLIQSSPQGCFMQSWAWADFKEVEGYKTFRYGLFNNEDLVGGCLFHFFPGHHDANLLMAPGGPFLLPGFETEGIQLLIDQAAILAKQWGAIALRIEPLLSEKPDYLKGFVRAPVDLLPSETLLIDLRPTEAEILQAMKPKGRYNVRLSQRHEVETCFTTNPQAIPTFYDLFWETVDRHQFFGEPYGFFINLCQTLYAANMAEIGLAIWKGEVLAAMLLVYWGDPSHPNPTPHISHTTAPRAIYLYGGRSPHHPHVMASYGLHWAAMQRAKSKGYEVYDFYGYTRNPNHGYAKFSQFKRQFGGTPVTTIGAHDYWFYDRLADVLIGVLHRLKT